MGFWKKCPLCLTVVGTSMALTLVVWAGKNNFYKENLETTKGEPMVTAALEAAGDGKFPWQMAQSVETVSEIEKEEPPKELEPIFTAQAQTKPVATPQPPKGKDLFFSAGRR